MAYPWTVSAIRSVVGSDPARFEVAAPPGIQNVAVSGHHIASGGGIVGIVGGIEYIAQDYELFNTGASPSGPVVLPAVAPQDNFARYYFEIRTPVEGDDYRWFVRFSYVGF